MPSPEARAAFDTSQSLSGALQELATREQLLVERIREAETLGEVDKRQAEIHSLRGVRSDLATQHTAAIDHYVDMVRDAIRGR